MNFKEFIDLLDLYENISRNVIFQTNKIIVCDEDNSCIMMCQLDLSENLSCKNANVSIVDIRNILSGTSLDVINTITLDDNFVFLQGNITVSIPSKQSTKLQLNINLPTCLVIIPLKSCNELFDVLISHSIFSGFMEVHVKNKQLNLNSKCEVGTITTVKNLVDVTYEHLFGINIKYMRFITMFAPKNTVLNIVIRNNMLELCFYLGSYTLRILCNNITDRRV